MKVEIGKISKCGDTRWQAHVLGTDLKVTVPLKQYSDQDKARAALLQKACDRVKKKNSFKTTKHVLLGQRSIPIKYLEPYPTNPKERSEGKRVAALVDEIALEDVLEPIRVYKVARNLWRILDGHRRFTAAQLLGKTHMICDVYKTSDPEELSALWKKEGHGAGRKRWGGLQWAQQWAEGNEEQKQATLRTTSPSFRHNILTCCEVWGEEGYRKLVLEHRQAPEIATSIRRLQSGFDTQLGVSGSAKTKPKKPTARQIGNWLREHTAQGEINHWCARTPKSNQWAALARAISSNKPYKF